MPNSKQIVYLSQAQYVELIADGSITVDGVTITYDENDIYVTPQDKPIVDVQINGTSIADDGVAYIPPASTTTLGVAKVSGDYGTGVYAAGGQTLFISKASDEQIKAGNQYYKPIVPTDQHKASFYGLAKAAGDSTQSQSSNTVGTYTDSAKSAIQSMLGVSQMLAPVESDATADRAYAIGEIFSYNGKLYQTTDAIAQDGNINPGINCQEVTIVSALPHDVQVNGTSVVSNGVANVPIADRTVLGAIKIASDYGIQRGSSGLSQYAVITFASSSDIKTSDTSTPCTYHPVTPRFQHESAFYGLAKAAGDITQSASSNSVGTYTDEAKAAIRTMLGTVGDVSVNGTSIVQNGSADIPVAQSNVLGVVKAPGTYGVSVFGGGSAGTLAINPASVDQIKSGNSTYNPISPANNTAAAFYGLAKAAGDATQSASSNAVGTYTDEAKAAIKSMLGVVDGSTGTIDVSGTTPTISAIENTRYICGEVSTLTVTPASSGVSIIRFTSGTTPTVLTVTGVTWPEWFDADNLEADTVYEICITDGEYGAVMTWPL